MGVGICCGHFGVTTRVALQFLHLIDLIKFYLCRYFTGLADATDSSSTHVFGKLEAKGFANLTTETETFRIGFYCSSFLFCLLIT